MFPIGNHPLSNPVICFDERGRAKLGEICLIRTPRFIISSYWLSARKKRLRLVINPACFGVEGAAV